MGETAVLLTTEEEERRRVHCGAWYDDHYESARRFAVALERVVEAILGQLDLKTLPTQVRVKSRESFVAKCLHPARDDRRYFRYADPIKEISDLVGARITLYLLGDSAAVIGHLQEGLICTEQSVKGMGDERVPGYRGRHFNVTFTPERLRFPEFREFNGMTAELQLRTVLQHAWAEIQHDLIYKPRIAVPVDIQRRLVGLAGILDVADREFETVTQTFGDYVEARADEDAELASTDELLSSAIDSIIAVPDVPMPGDVWIRAFEEIVIRLGMDSAAVTAAVSDAERQRAVVRALTEETGPPNKVQVANALVAWHAGADYADKHPRAFEPGQNAANLRTEVHQWIERFTQHLDREA